MAAFPGDFESDSLDFDDHLALHAAIGRIWSHDPALADFVGAEMRRAAEDPQSNVLCVGTDGDLTVTIILVPQAMIANETGPVLMPSANPSHILAAASMEVVSRKANECLAMGPTVDARSKWDATVNWFFDRAVAYARLGVRPFVPDAMPDQ